jgi:ABC-type transport system involved in cytochrome bd biosynthesis fused ATPase/permease subunit
LRRDALVAGAGDALGLLTTGVTVVAVLAIAVQASGHRALDRVLIAMLALLALATFDAVTPLAATARELSRTLAAGRGCSSQSTDRLQPATSPRLRPLHDGHSRSASST